MSTKKLIWHLAGENSGSATITVVVTMLMMVALGAALLFGAYTSYKIALSQKQDAKNYYTAESAMDDIRTGIQNAVSEALINAYTQTLEEYAVSDDALFDFQRIFADHFDTYLKTSGFYFENGEYNAGKLKTYIDEERLGAVGSCTLSPSLGTAAITIENGVKTAITLKQLGLHWISEGYESDITTDIVINIPGFSRNLGDFAVVAQNGIIKTGTQPGASDTINGNVFSGGDFIVASGSLELNGDAYVGDDLILSGNAVSAKFSGKYVGFGGSDTAPEESSAIIISGKNTSLDISGLQQLTLAGVSFIDLMGKAYSDKELSSLYQRALPMGQSMSFKANQLAYLAPVECIENYASNPFVLHKQKLNGNEAVIAPVLDDDIALWSNTKLSYYLKNGRGSLKTLYKNLDNGSQQIAYVFLVFNTREAANEYFRDYFAIYPERIQQYGNLYLSDFDSMQSGAISTAGNMFSEDEDGNLTLLRAVPEVAAAGRRFSDFVNTTNLNALEPETTLSFGSGAAIVTNAASYNTTGSERLLISTGDVFIKGSLTGTVLAQGTVTLGDPSHCASLTAAPLPKELLKANTGGYMLSSFLQPGYGGEMDGSNQWSPEKLVIYQNWQKN